MMENGGMEKIDENRREEEQRNKEGKTMMVEAMRGGIVVNLEMVRGDSSELRER